MNLSIHPESQQTKLRRHSYPGWILSYCMAVVAVAAALWLRMALEAWVGPGLATYITFYPAVMVVALLGGFGPGLAATALTCIVTVHWILPPIGQFTVDSPVDRLGLAVFASMGLFMSAVAVLYHRSRDRAAALERESALKESQEFLRHQAERIDPARAEIIAREMLRVLREQVVTRATAAEPAGKTTQRVSAVAGAIVVGVGLLVLLGWALDLEPLKSILPGLATMKANTALCFLLAGVALLLSGRRVVRLVCAGVVCAVSGLTLAEYISGANFGIDQILFRDLQDQHTIYPGRMVEATALGFLLSGVSLLLLKVRAQAAVQAQQALALGTAIIGAVAFLGYIYDVQQLYRFAGYSSMALHTAASLVVLAAGLLFARSDGLSAVLMTSGPGTQLARLLLPTAILVPMVMGWMIHKGEVRGFYNVGMGVALFALLMIMALGSMIWLTAYALNSADAVRRENETDLRNLTDVMNHAHEPLIVREIGGVIRAWNRGAETLYGWSASDVLGRCKQTLLQTEGHPAEEIDRQLESMGRWEGVLHQTTRDGRRVTVESRQTARRVGDGQMLILESNLDITERRQAEEALHESRERLELALASSKMATFDWDILKDKRTWSDGVHSLLGTIPETFKGSAEEFFRIVHPEDRSTVQAALAMAVESTGVYITEYRAVWPDGSVHHISARGKVQYDSSGRAVLMTGICWDITGHKQAEQKLQKANDELEARVTERTRELATALQTLQVESAERIQAVEALRQREQMLIQQSRQAAMGEMIGNIAHQWRQPLNVLALQVQQLLMLHDFGKLTRESLNSNVSSSMELIQHMSGTIDDFRNYFRPDKGKTEFALSGVITNTLSLIEDSFRNERISIEIRANDDPVITGYRNEFAQVILNILNNARDVLIEREISDPRVTISLCAEGGRAVVSIADNAGGVPEEIMGKIFDPYFTTKGPQTGTGVGLFMSKSIIEKNMGGMLTVRNTADGAEFRIEVRYDN